MVVRFTDRFAEVTENTAQKQTEEEGYTPSLSYIGDIRVDLIKAMSPNSRWELSRHTIDNTSDIADHRLKMPVDLILTVLVADDEPGTDDDNQAVRVSDSPRTWQDKIAEIEDAIEIDQVYEIITPKKIYPSMMVVGYAPEISVDISNGEQFAISFSSVKLSDVNVSGVDASMVPKKRKPPKPPSPQDEADATKAATQADTGTKTPEPAQSWAQQLGLNPTNLWR